ncbi:MAG: molecular chaperone TorD family protein [Planctomycetales bacterium]|nr:molecular chaperone TorD family protein [Planctomycetales bacterium]
MSIQTIDQVALDSALPRARQALYRFAAVALLDPKYGTWALLQKLRSEPLLASAAEVLRETATAEAEELGLGELPLAELDPEAVWRKLPPSDAALNTMYERTFGLLVSAACPPYETEYIPSKFTFQRGNTLADVSGFYRAFGLTTSLMHAERPDHIVLELEFMAFLLGREREADEQQDRALGEPRAAVCRQAQTRFLQEHLAPWATLFAKLLQRENPGGFYEAVGNFLAALIPAERSLLGVAVPQQAAQAPSQIEPLDACDGCQLHGDPQLGT